MKRPLRQPDRLPSIQQPVSRRGVSLLAAALAIAVWSTGQEALAQQRLYEKEPYDLIYTFNQKEGPLKVQKLNLPKRQVPNPLPKTGRLIVHLFDSPDAEYEVPWHLVERIDLFEQLVLAEANRLVLAGQLDQAYEYFQYMLENMPYTERLNESIDNYYMRQAQAFVDQNRLPNAMAVYFELYRRNPNYPHLDERLGAVADSQTSQYVSAGNLWAARQLLRSLATKYPQHPVVKKWETRLRDEAGQLLAQARSALEAGGLESAEQASRRSTQIWPGLPGAEQLARAIHEKYPRVVVGVTSPAHVFEPGSLMDWAARRSSRLVYRTLLEFLGPGTDGGKYRCPVGQLEVEQLGRRLVFRLKPDQRWSRGDSILSGPVLARRLLAMTDPHDAAYRPEWSELLEKVSSPSVYEVYADLTRFHVRPQAFLETILLPYGDPALGDQKNWWNGPYVVQTQNDKEIVYVANPSVPLATSVQPRQIVERYFDRGERALDALRRREIDLVDRVNPWVVDELRHDKTIVVEPYAVPLVHCLIPNLQKPLTGNRTFRRALVYAIQREAILERLIGNRPPDGSLVVSGPFSVGTSPQDPLGYAYDDTIEPRGYEPRLAISLAEVARRELAAKSKDGQWKKLPALVLAHPPDEAATVACTMIKKQLKRLGLEITLQAMPPEACNPLPENVDLLYAELAMWEPIADARRLLGNTGPSGNCSSYMALALRQLEQATDWQEAGARLRRIHQIAFNEIAVVPLWQLIDYYARQNSLEGIGKRPVLLYQDVEAWQPAYHYPSESP